MGKKYILVMAIFLVVKAGFSQIVVGTYTGITQLSNITSVCTPAVNAVLGDTAFYINSGVEIPMGTSFTGTWANGLAYSDGPGSEILCVSVHTEEWWDVELLLSDMSFTNAINADMITIADYINLDFVDCSGNWYYNYSYDRRVKELDFASFTIPAGLQVIGARFTLTGDNAANPDPIGMLLIQGVSGPTQPTASNNGPICEGDTLKLFVDHIDSATYSWTGPNAFSSTLENPVIPNATMANAGTYTVYVTDSASNVDTAYTTVIINPSPTGTFVLPQLCETTSGNFSLTLPNDTITSYHWDFGTAASNDTSNAASPSFTYAAPGTYVVTLQFTSDEGCTSTIDTTVVVHENPTATLSNTFACVGSSQTFDPVVTSDTTVTYSWSFPNANPGTSTDSVPTVTFPNGGAITIGLTLTTAAGCSAGFTFPFNVSTGFGPNFGVYPMCNNRFTFDPIHALDDSTWVLDWDMGDGTTFLNQDTSTFNYIFTSAGTYNVQMVVTNGSGCVDSVTIPVTVNDSVFIDMPNILVKSSTVGNNKVDFQVFKPGFNLCVEYTYTIFDRWGVKVFETHNDPYNPDVFCADCFSGKTENGTPLSPGVYYYVIEGNFHVLKSGAITVFD